MFDILCAMYVYVYVLERLSPGRYPIPVLFLFKKVTSKGNPRIWISWILSSIINIYIIHMISYILWHPFMHVQHTKIILTVHISIFFDLISFFLNEKCDVAFFILKITLNCKVGVLCVVMIIMVVLVVSLSVLCVVVVDMMVLMVGVRVLDVVLGKIQFRFFKTK